MLFFEQVRQIQKEKVLYENTASQIASVNAVCDWTEEYSKTVTLDEDSLVYVKWSTGFTTSDMAGASMLKVDDVPVTGSGYLDSGSSKVRHVYLKLTAGSHTFKWYLSLFDAGSSSGILAIGNIKIAVLDFSNKWEGTYSATSVSIPQASWTTVLSTSISTPLATAVTPLGNLKNKTVLILLWVENSVPYRRNKFDSGAQVSGVTWNLKINGSSVNPTDYTEKYEDFGDNTSNNSYGNGSSALHVIAVKCNTTLNLELEAYQSSWADGITVNAYMRVLVCPWIIPPGEYEPITLDFPGGSTVYVVLEPTHTNPTKTVKIGKKRFVSFGDADDYYVKSEGTDILQFNYTFELLPVSNVSLIVEGWGGCISIIGVDVR